MANEFINEKYRETIKKLTLFDAILFRKAFDLNIPAAETLLRTIMENDKIKVARCKTEYTVTGLASHSVQLDLLAMDEIGRLIHDFSCLNSKDIYDETLKECVKRYKETEEGIQTMCTVMEELRNEGMQQGIQQGIKQGNKQGMQRFADLTKKLLALHRTNDLNRAIEDEQYRDKLFKEFAIQ